MADCSRGRRASKEPPVACAMVACALLALSGSALALERDAHIGNWSASGYAEAYGVIRTNRDSQRQRPAGIFALALTGDLHPRMRVVLDTRTMFGGPAEGADGLGIYNSRDTFQNISPAVDIEEGYADVFLGPVDLRIGKQKFAWGKLDTIQPTDVVNPERFTDPFVMEEQDAKIGVPAVRASYFAPPLGPKLPSNTSLTLIWVPVPVPTRFPLQDERWFPESISLSDSLSLGAQDFDLGSVTLTRQVRVRNALETENRHPPRQLDEGAVGLRAAGSSGGLDWSVYYYEGTETSPNFDLTTSLRWPRARRAARAGRPPPIPQPGEPIRLRADATLSPRFGRIRLFGADVAFDLAGSTLRAEATYGMDRLLPRSTAQLVDAENLTRRVKPVQDKLFAKLLAGDTVRVDLGELTVARDTVAWGVGIDYLWEGWTPLLQMNQVFILDNRAELLVNDIDTQLLFILRKSFFADRLEAKLATMQGLERGYTMNISRFTYDLTDKLRIRLGYLFIAGSRRTIIGQYQENDQGFLQLRYSY